MTRSRDVADTQDNLGGAVAPFVAGKNKIINGDFGVWQRGTFGFSFGAAFNADRWQFYRDGSGATEAITRQTFTPGTAPVSGYEGQYFWRYAATVAGTGGTERSLYTKMEDVTTFAGQTVTLSFWAKADATRTVSLALAQNFGSGGSATVTTSLTSQSVTTSWVRYSVSVAVPSISGKTVGTSSYLQLTMGFPVNVTETIDIWGVQVEAGSVATAFSTATGTIQGELAACQRYYQNDQSAGSGSFYPTGYLMQGTASNRIVCNIFFPVQMRTQPTITLSSASPYWESTPFSVVGSITSATADASKMSPSGGVLSILGTFGTTPVQSYPGLFGSNQLKFSAEL
jgi:hypothetical protein